ncbi:sugar phosphate nucleotidyltransferase [Oribacterium sp. WCC10]|uniref:sugar phosphate nucleotidyltransferase n=1 Tax=Oribacterium sp. WCC10 TaxID=1855343 RepID=UPI0008F29D00|nr:sugar phosphate nucleotidyltransferase [Oribacterium sp. WCC10]SFG39748.1 CTP:phosphocholine cytidylyltransferase [Oribacterium sp. WCC10]
MSKAGRESIIILRTLYENKESTQRDIALQLEVSLGKTNKLISETVEEGLLSKVESSEGRGRNVSYELTEKGKKLLEKYRVDRALILASGFGSRFVPLTYETPKGLLEVFGERMIERQIRQLHEVGVRDITIMVGYLKEKFDYLIDKYDVKLIYNPEFSSKNTLATMHHAKDFLKGKNCYILSSDNWMRNNIYHSYEADAWYAATFMNGETREWAMETGRNGAIKEVHVGGSDKWCMYGPVYFTKEFSDAFLPLIEAYYKMPGTEQFYWEDVLIRNLRNLPDIYINKRPDGEVYEFENLEELRLFDEKYINDSGSRAMQLVSDVFGVPESGIVNIRCLKAGMTNKSWYFNISDDPEIPEKFRGKAYICRIPGPGTEKLINRRHEGDVYKAVTGLGITEELVYFNAENGYKISRYYNGARNADYTIEQELTACMAMLKKLHNSGIKLNHEFDFRRELLGYEKDIREVNASVPYEDYPTVRMQAEEVLGWLESLNRPKTIAHIDSVKDNFIFTDEGLKMIDWEYAGMADPLVDIAMAAIYSYMTYEETGKLIEVYADASEGSGDRHNGDFIVAYRDVLDGKSAEVFGENGGIALNGENYTDAYAIVVAYMGMGGLLWALWGVYKMALGESFGDYTLKMYRYFKDSYKILRKLEKI